MQPFLIHIQQLHMNHNYRVVHSSLQYQLMILEQTVPRLPACFFLGGVGGSLRELFFDFSDQQPRFFYEKKIKLNFFSH